MNTQVLSFDFMRLFLALVVIFCHTGTITGLYNDPRLIINNYYYTGGNLAVFAFFFISGFVITSSYLHSKSWWDFALKRLLRIYPGYWIALLVGTFLVIPILYSGTSLNQQFEFLGKNFSVLNVTCSPTDNSLPSQGSCLNNPVWTLVSELSAYLVVLLLGVLGLLRKKILLIFAFVVLTILYYMRVSDLEFHNLLKGFGGDYLTELIPFLSWFLAGVLYFNFKEFVVLKWRFAIPCVLVLLVSLIPSFARTFQTEIIVNFGAKAFEPLANVGYFIPQIFPLVAPLPAGYLILFLADKLPLKWWKNVFGDLSYGTYIYGWMVQRVLFENKVHEINIPLYITACISIALVLGFLSWNLVEKPVLDLYKSKSKARI
jgi:peptidoglycan/LPS O-acetylase OafA/YrhL